MTAFILFVKKILFGSFRLDKWSTGRLDSVRGEKQQSQRGEEVDSPSGAAAEIAHSRLPSGG